MSLEDDVFTENTPTIVDCDVLEAAKENVQPLGTGRRVTALSAILATPHAQRDSKLAATRHRLRINVELALDDEEDADADALEAYCRLVYWTVENYPQGPSVESGLLELLEEATRVLKDDRGGKWRADVKYLKLWLLYASFVERPTLIYRFLIANEIGTEHALLYEEYAAVLERDGRRKDADDAYVLGIARRAQPLDHLKARHDDFQKRMMSNILAPPPPAGAPPARARAVLGSTGTVPSSSSSSSSAAPARPTRIPSSSRSASTSNAPLQIFVDPTGSASHAASESASPNAWTDLPARKTRIKENVPETKKLAGTRVKHTGAGAGAGRAKRGGASVSGASGSRIAVFRDPDPGPVPEGMPPPPGRARTKPGRDGDVGVGVGMPGTPVIRKSSSSVVPFVDCVPAEGQGRGQAAVPATPRFMPFRDEAIMTTTMITPAAPTSVMKPKTGVGRMPGSASEMEALRKDPLKNYPDGGFGVYGEGDG